MRKLVFTSLIVLAVLCVHIPQCFALPSGELNWTFIADAKGNFDDGDGDELYWIDPDGGGVLEPFWIDPDGPSGDPPFKIFGCNNSGSMDFHMRDYGSARNAFKVYCNMETSYGVCYVMMGDTTTFSGGWLLEIHLYDVGSFPMMSAELKYIKDIVNFGIYSRSEVVDIPQDPFELFNGPRDFYIQGGCYASTPGGPNDSIYFQITHDFDGSSEIAAFDYMPGAGEPTAESFNAVGFNAYIEIGSVPANGETVGFDEIYTSVLPDPTDDDTLIDRSIFLFDVLASVQANDFHIVVQPASIADVDMAGVYSGAYQLDEIYEDPEGVHFDWSLPAGTTPVGGVETFGVTLLDDIQCFDGKLQWTLNGLPVGIPASIWQDWTLEGGQPYAVIRNGAGTTVYVNRKAGLAEEPLDIVALEALNDPPIIVTPDPQPAELDPNDTLTFSFAGYPGYKSNLVFYDVYDNPAGTGTPLISFRTAAVIDLENLCGADEVKYPIAPSPASFDTPLPDDFFGPGSDPFDNPISLGPEDVPAGAPKPVTTTGGFRWDDDMILWDPPAPVNWELLKLKMKSSEPVHVEDADDSGSFPPDSFFDIYVELDMPSESLPVGDAILSRSLSGQGQAVVDFNDVPITITFLPQGANDESVVPITINADADIDGTLNWTRGSCGPCCDDPICFEPGGTLDINFTVTGSNGGANINGWTGTITQTVGSCLEGDLNGDGEVTLPDFVIFARNWLVGT